MIGPAMPELLGSTRDVVSVKKLAERLPAPSTIDVDDQDQQGEQGDAEEGEQANGEADLAQLGPALAAERCPGHADLDHVGGGRRRRRGHQS